MKGITKICVLIIFCLAVLGGQVWAKSTPKDPSTVRCAVIGGHTYTVLWPEIVRMFEKETGYKVKTVVTGPRPVLANEMHRGNVDLLTMHSGDITTDLVADGYAVNMRPWIHNNLVIIGPESDPAGIRGMKKGSDALRKIATTQSNFVNILANGPREVGHTLWKDCNIKPIGNWVVKDECPTEQDKDIVQFCREKNAYAIFGRIPFLLGKHDSMGMDIMVENDPRMHRPYIVMEANPKVFPEANVKGARALSDFLVSDKVQRFLATFRADEFGGIPLFYPLRGAAFQKN